MYTIIVRSICLLFRLFAKTVKQKEQPSIRHKLDQEKAQSKAQHKEKVKVKTKDRGVEL